MFSSSFLPLDSTICSAVGVPYHQRVEIAVIDTSLSDWRTLRDGVKAGTEVMLIGRHEDGLLALAQALDERRGISAIHVLSHGFPGGFVLGSARLDASSVSRYTPALEAIGASLSNDADILLYSCRTASGEGPALLSALSALTGANVAASYTLTGASAQGGDWELGYRSAHIMSGVALTDAAMRAYPHTLTDPQAVPAVTEALFVDTGNSSTDNITQYAALSGSGDANAVVTFTEGATGLGIATADSDGSWSFTPDLMDGIHTVTASETNSSGTGTASLTFTLEANAPPLPVTLQNDTGSSPSDNVTSNAILQGSGTPDAAVTFLENGATIGNATADNNGAWSFTPPNLLDGLHIISAQETDTAGNIATGTVTFNLDTTAPDAPAFTSPGLTDNTLPVITGTAEVGSTITVTIADATYTTTATDGTWSLDLSTATPTSGVVSLDPDGPNSLSATATDAAGNVSMAGIQTLTVDTVAPDAPLFTSPDLTNSANPPLITGTAEPGSTVTLTGGGAIYTVTTSPDGTWGVDTSSAVPTSGSFVLLPDSGTPFAATATDAAGNSSAVGTQTLTIDTTAPDAPAFTSANLTSNTMPSITGTAEPGSAVTVIVGGAIYTTTATEGAWSINLGIDTPVAGSLSLNDNGDNDVSATATDQAGNSSAVGMQTLTIDTTAPAAPVITSPSLTDSITPVVSGTAEPGSTVTLTIGGATYNASAAPDGTWTINLSTATPDSGIATLDPNGDNIVSATATDAVGNMSMLGMQTLTIDTTAPAAPFIEALDPTRNTTPVIAGQAEVGSTVKVTVGGATYTMIAPDGAWSINLGTDTPTAGSLSLKEGGNKVSATATDAAGNSSAVGTQTLTIDTTPPGAPVITSPALTGSAAPVITGTAEAGSAITVRVAAAFYATTATPKGTWSINLATSTPYDGTLSLNNNGDNEVSATATDAVGNMSTAGTQILTIDTTAPAAPVITSPALTGSAAPVITGTAEAGSTVTVYVGGGNGGASYSTVAADGGWSINLAIAKPNKGNLSLNLNGINSITAKAIDPAGNTSNPTNQKLTIDTTAGAAPAGLALAPASDSGIMGDGITNVAQPTITGTGKTGETVTLFDNDVAIGSATVTKGIWSITPEMAMIAGSHSLTAKETDAVGNVSVASAVLPLVIDTTPPAEPAITSPGLSNITTPVITGTADAGSAIAVTVDGVTYATSATSSGTWTVNLATAVPSGAGILSLDANGANSVSVTATDAAGNTSAPAPFALTIDTTPPAVTATLAANPHDTASTTYTPVLDGGGDPNASVTISEGGTAIGTAQADATGAWSFDLAELAAGAHTLVASETDAAGNTGTSAAVPLTVSPAVATDQRFDVNTGNAPKSGSFFGSDYAGPFPGLQAQFGYVGTENVTVIANVPNVFIYSGSGDDALMAKAGSNVLDGGGGSNWMVGASGADGGKDTFFVYNPSGQNTWDTLLNFHVGDMLTVWDFNPAAGSFTFTDNLGAADYTGLTIVANLGNGTGALGVATFAGLSSADAHFVTSTGTSGGLGYLAVTRVA